MTTHNKPGIGNNRILLFLLFFIGLILLKALLSFVSGALLLDRFENSTDVGLSQLVIAFWLLIFFPVYEEITFRLPLRFNTLHLSISTAMVFGLFFYTHEMDYLFTRKAPHLSSRLILFSIFSFVLIFLIYQKAVSQRLQSVWKNQFATILVMSQLLCALIHLNKYSFKTLDEYFYMIPIILIYFAIACYFSLVRLKLGIIASIIAHIFFNASGILFLLLSDGSIKT